MIARVGDATEIAPCDVRTIAQLDLTVLLNDRRELASLAQFADGSEALLRARVPERLPGAPLRAATLSAAPSSAPRPGCKRGAAMARMICEI